MTIPSAKSNSHCASSSVCRACTAIDKFPRQRFVLDHLAKPPIKNREIDVWARGIRELATFPNVFCKLSGMVTEADWQKWKLEDLVPYIDIAFETFGADRLMFGSDWPVCLTVAPYSHVVGTIKNYLSARLPAVQDAVLGGNAQRFYRLKS